MDVIGNYYNSSSYFTITGGFNLLLCSNKTMFDEEGNLNVFQMTTYSILGISTGTGGTWLFAQTLNSNVGNLYSLHSSVSSLSSQLHK